MIQLEYSIYLSIILVAIGLYGIFTRRSMIRILLGTEIILNAATLNLVVFSTHQASVDLSGQIITLFVIAMAAAETIIGLILLILLYRGVGSIDISLASAIKGSKDEDITSTKSKDEGCEDDDLENEEGEEKKLEDK